MNTTANSQGFAVHIVIMLIAVAGLLGGTGWYVWQHQPTKTQPLNSASHLPTTARKVPAATATPSPQRAATPVATTPTTATTPSAATKATASTTPSVVTPSTAVAPTPASVPVSLSIASDGCSTSASGVPGSVVHIESHNTRKGGSDEFTLPSSGVVSNYPVGGLQGFTVEVTLSDASGNLLLQRTGTLTKNCNL